MTIVEHHRPPGAFSLECQIQRAAGEYGYACMKLMIADPAGPEHDEAEQDAAAAFADVQRLTHVLADMAGGLT